MQFDADQNSNSFLRMRISGRSNVVEFRSGSSTALCHIIEPVSAFWLLSLLLSRLTGKAMSLAHGASQILQTSEVTGTVRSMTLVTTNMMTPDNKLLVVPNNELWGKVVTNATGSNERRVDLVFGIGYGDDIEQAERVLNEVVTAHPAVLREPEPVIAVSELAASSVNLICRPWVKTPDYWTAYWDITRAVKERFDAEGISIPFPQRDVHLIDQGHPVPEPNPEAAG